jgi:putative ABC transport system ATP-binding protein
MDLLLEIKSLAFRYENAPEAVFENLDFNAEAGAFIIIKGASGAGKSTLLRLICRLNRPRSGAIYFKGRTITELAPSELRSRIGYMAQIPQMIEGSVRENLLLPFSFAVNRSKKPPAEEELRLMLDDFYLGQITLGQSAMKLSTGQKQRLAMMRTILQQPDMMLLDEPTSALDRDSAAMVFAIMENLSLTKGMTMITVTHTDYLPEKAMALVYRLENRTLNLMA